MNYENVGAACTKHFCRQYQDLMHECPLCPVAKECWAGYHVEGCQTTGDFIIWLDKYHDGLSRAVEAAIAAEN